MATVPPDAAEYLEPLAYKRWILKVSIHCEGCRRKVKKVLHSIEGVYNVDIETKQQKVIVTGNVEAETLIKKLTKSGKHAELWPQIAGQKEKKSSKSKKKEKQSDPESNSQEAGHGGPDPDTEKQDVKVEVVKEPQRSTEGGGGSPAKISGGCGGGSSGAVKFSDGGVKISGGSGSGGTVKFSDGVAKISCGGGGGEVKFSDGVVKISGGGGGGVKFSDGVVKTGGGGGGGQVLDSKPEGKKPETSAFGNHAPAADKDSSESDDSAEKSGGNSGKKKKKQGQKTAPETDPSSGGAPARSGSPNRYAGPPQVNLSPPRHHGHQYPSHYYAPPQPVAPVYAVNYSTAYPTSSYTTPYYASPTPHSYAYTYPSPQMEPAPSDSDYSYQRQPLDSFEIFSDENPNGCSIM